MATRKHLPSFSTARNSCRTICLVLFSVFLGLQASAQNKKYIIFFKNKGGGNPYSLSNPSEFLSAKSIQRRVHQNLPLDSTDLPVSPAYINTIKQAGALVLNPLKWINAAIIECSGEVLNQIIDFPFVEISQPLNSKLPSSVVKKLKANGTQSLDYGSSANQNIMLGIDSMHSWGYHGEGMTIAVMDAGFQNVHTHAAFNHLFQNNKILGVRDIVANDGDVYQDHWHGGAVLSNIAGYLPGSIIGGAYNASFFLIRTEDANTEFEVECAYWVAGLELADSIGADLVNSSLGYTTFDPPGISFTYSSLNGQSFSSKAASMAAAKGMVVLNSAGNEGNNNSWGGWIAVPADAENILTVGSVGPTEQYSNFSGKGPTADGRIKPDLVAQGGSAVIADVFTASGITTNGGTSFSCPIMCGLAAGFWQAHPELNARQVMAHLKNSGSNKDNPNNLIGWGIPGFVKAHILAGARPTLSFPFDLHIFPNPNSGKIMFIELLESNAVGDAKYKITDAKGSVVLENQIHFDLSNQRIGIELPKMRSGMYFVQIEMGGRSFSRKVVMH